MAIYVSEFLEKQKEVSTQITPKEIEIVDGIESYIDTEIMKYYDTFSKEIKLDLCIANFRYNPIIKQSTNYAETSRVRMQKELEKRYKSAGWKTETFIDTSGSMNEQDLWILKIK